MHDYGKCIATQEFNKLTEKKFEFKIKTSKSTKQKMILLIS